MAGQQSPSLYWLKKNKPASGRTNALVSKSFNKSGVFLGGSGSSGTMSYKDVPTPSLPPVQGKNLERLYGGKTAMTAPGGSGPSVKSQFVGEGDNKKYVDVAEANKDRGKVSTGTKPDSTYSSSSRPTPTRASTKELAKDLAEKSNKNSGSEPDVYSLNYFMRKTMADGKGNQKNRAYTLYKRYQQSQRRG